MQVDPCSFEREEAETQALLAELKRRDVNEAAPVDRLLDEHRSIGLRYRDAIAMLDANDPLGYRVVDTKVRGTDRPLTDEMSARPKKNAGRPA